MFYQLSSWSTSSSSSYTYSRVFLELSFAAEHYLLRHTSNALCSIVLQNQAVVAKFDTINVFIFDDFHFMSSELYDTFNLNYCVSTDACRIDCTIQRISVDRCCRLWFHGNQSETIHIYVSRMEQCVSTCTGRNHNIMVETIYDISR